MLRPTLVRAASPAYRATGACCRAASASASAPIPPILAAVAPPPVAARQHHRTQTRPFSASPHANVKVLFDPTDSPELDETLSTILHKIILPSRLPEKQRSLVFDPDRRQYLLENPVVIEVEDYEYRFPTLDVKQGDVPSTRRIFWEALRQMRTRRDWANLSTLLYGLREAGRNWEPAEEVKMIRLASEAGHPFPIIDCARQWQRTGLRLDTPEKVLQTMWGICMMAVDKGWDDEDAWRRAVRWGEMVSDLVQEEAHRAMGHGMHRNPVMQALMLFPLANIVQRHQGGVDTNNALRRRLDLVLLLWPEGRGLTNMFTEAAYKNRVRGLAVLRDPTQLLLQGSLILSALATTRQVLSAGMQGKESQMIQRLRGMEKTVLREIRPLYQKTDLHAAKGRAAYDKTVKELGLDGSRGSGDKSSAGRKDAQDGDSPEREKGPQKLPV